MTLEPVPQPDPDETVDAELVDPASGVADPTVLGRVISDDRSPTFQEVRFRLRPQAAVSPGRLVAVCAEEAPALLLCRVLDVHEVNPHEDAQSSATREVLPFGSKYAREGSSTVIFRVARCEPVEELPLYGDGRPGAPHEVQTLPRAGALVVPAAAELVTAALGLLADPLHGLHVGSVHAAPDVPVVLKPATAQRHVLIVGGIGSGKSYTRGVLAEELHALGAPQVNIDVNGEMVDAARELGGQTVVPGGGFTLPLASLTREDLLEAISGVQRGTNIETLVGYAFDSLQRRVRQRGIGSFDVDDLVAEIGDVAQPLNMHQPGTLHPARQRAQALDRLPYLGARFDWEAALRPGGFVNIDCRGMLLSDLRVVAAAVARDLQSLARSGRIPFTVLSIDEFHLVAPNDDRNVSTQVLREIARIGRHLRLGLILTTQSPADVDRAILKRLLTRFVHTIEPDQLESLRGVLADTPPEVIRGLSKLPQGSCLMSGVVETVRHAAVIDVRPRWTTHGGTTPDVWADLRRRGWPGKRERSDRP